MREEMGREKKKIRMRNPPWVSRFLVWETKERFGATRLLELMRAAIACEYRAAFSSRREVRNLREVSVSGSFFLCDFFLCSIFDFLNLIDMGCES
jgi:hypothetical protein